ncbi:MAG: hypothetical protein MZV63_39775 [Marinilabiliales bacterium]|nr:hypothetical protein [Marinilabiliales bacterium]
MYEDSKGLIWIKTINYLTPAKSKHNEVSSL